MSTVNSAAEPPARRAIRAIAGTNLDGASAHNRRVIFDALRINGPGGRVAASPLAPTASCRKAPAPSACSWTGTRCSASSWTSPARR